jgi:L-alanine-DL-glutamate epimerase-like enolase superfamily enzyme
MRITDIRCYPVNLAVNPQYVIKTTLGVHSSSHYVFVAIECSDGTIGWGEATVVPIWSGETQAGAMSIIGEIFAPLLRGKDPFDIEAIMQALDASVIDNIFTKAAVEMALFDAMGKSLGMPVYKLLGGKANPSPIPIKFSIGARSPEDSARIAAEKVAEGFQAIKVKVGTGLEQDLERVRLVREAIGSDILLNLDVNGGWGVKESIRAIPRFYEFDLEYVEQPTPRYDIDGLAQVRKAVEVPIMADESVFTVHQAMQVIRKEAADIISVYPGKNGGMLKTRLICKMAEAAGIACHMGSNLEWDIATSAMIHLAVCTANIKSDQFPVDILGPLYYEPRLNSSPVRLKEQGLGCISTRSRSVS